MLVTPSIDLPENIVKTIVTKISYECKDCRSVIHIGEYAEESNRVDSVLSEWLDRHKPGHRYRYPGHSYR